MKKAVSLILAFVLCLSLCACGGGNNTTPTEAPTTTTTPDTTVPETTVPETSLIDVFTEKLWEFVNEYQAGFCFNKDGSIAYPNSSTAGTWELNGTIIQCTFNDGSIENYEITNMNGTCLLVSDSSILTLFEFDGLDNIAWDGIPQKTVEITEDNWSEYFVVETITRVFTFTDMWGDVQESEENAVVFRLKDEYCRILCKNTEGIPVQYAYCGFAPQQVYMSTEDHIAHEYGIVGFVVDYECPVGEDYSFDLIRIQGTLKLVDGL